MSASPDLAAARRRRSPALPIVAVYAAASVAWILVSDRLVGLFAGDGEMSSWIQTAKGGLFVAVSAALLWWLISRQSRSGLRADDRARASQRRFENLVANLPGMAYRCRNDREWTMEYVSEGGRELTGYDPVELTDGRTSYASLIEPEDREAVWQQVQVALARDAPFLLVYRIRTRSGELRWVWEHGRAVRCPGGAVEALEGIVLDITERRSLEAQFAHAQKMEAVGRLAATVAHDFNNVLTGVIGFSELALMSLPPGEDRVRHHMEQVRNAGERGARIARQLLDFSRKPTSQAESVEVAAAVLELEPLLRRLLGEDVALRVVADDAAGTVLMEPTQLEQVIVNLAVNARDAMPRGGSLCIEVAAVVLDAEYVQRHAGAAPGPHVMIAVSDTGCGMDEATLARIYEPFFTTKPEGKGTGLGLATVHALVRSVGGMVWVYSEPDQGTTFKVYLPRADEAVAGGVSGSGVRGDLPRGEETVLLVEDDEAVRRLARLSLVQAGYTVLEAVDGDRARALCTGHDGPIDLMLADVVVPGVRFADLRAAAMSARPDLRVLCMSGYARNALAVRGVSAATAFVQKPITPVALVRKVREVLDAPARGPSARHAVIARASVPERTILVADDSMTARAYTCEVLSAEGYRVIEAADAEAALELALESPPDLLVTDLSMPGMSGAELIERLREHHLQLPIIVVSGHRREEATSQHRLAGVRYLEKPLLPEDLRRAVSNLLAAAVSEA